MKRRLVSAGVGVMSALLVGTTTASAMDCFVVNRSVQGAIQAGAHSSQWATLSVNDFLAGAGVTCPATVALFDQGVTAAGLPLVFATRTDKTLPSNGHGILHIDDTYAVLLPALGNQIIGVDGNPLTC